MHNKHAQHVRDGGGGGKGEMGVCPIVIVIVISWTYQLQLLWFLFTWDGVSIFVRSTGSSLLMLSWSAVPVAFMLSKSKEISVNKY